MGADRWPRTSGPIPAIIKAVSPVLYRSAEGLTGLRLAVMARLDRAIALFIALLLMARSSRAMTEGTLTRLSPNHLGALLTALSMLLFALMDAMSKLLVRDYPISEALWIRYMIFTLFALAIARPLGIRRMAYTARPWLHTIRSLLAVVEGATFVAAFQFLPLADTHAVGQASPLIVVAMSAPLLREKIGPHRWFS